MPTVDESPRARILAAAYTEFAAHGLAGARVDRIARAARTSKERLYVHYSSKDGLFAAVVAESMNAWVHAVPFEPTDLPGWAEELFRYFEEHGEDARLLIWAALGDTDYAAAADVDRDALEQRRAGIRDAQQAGSVDDRWTADELITMVFGLVLAWTVTPQVPGVGDDEARAQGHENRAAVVRDTVARAVAPR